MRTFKFAFLTLALCSALVTPSQSQSIIDTVAGGGPVNGAAVSTPLGDPYGLVIDGSGNIFVASSGLNRVYRIDPTGQLVIIAGNGTPGFNGDGGPTTSASLESPYRVAIDGQWQPLHRGDD